MSHPMVSGAVMFGRGENYCGVLVELRSEFAIDPTDDAALIEVRNKLWYVQCFTGLHVSVCS